MKKPSFLVLVVLCAFAVAAFGNTATTPVPRANNDPWLERHRGFVEIARTAQDCEVLFLGDSITDAWRRADRGLPVWGKYYAPRNAVNFGISGDRTQHLLWRLQHGEIGALHPKVVVMMIGTNNTGFESDKVRRRNQTPEIVDGIATLVRYLRTELPDTKLLLLAIFPRGEKDSPARAQVQEINRQIAKLHDGKSVHFLDLGQHFLEPDGTLSRDVMPDLLHPHLRGYAIWAQAMEGTLAGLLGEKPVRVDDAEFAAVHAP